MRIGILVDELAPGSAPKLVGWPIRKLAELGVDAEAIAIVEKDHWQKYKEVYDTHLAGVKIRYLFQYFPAFLRRCNFRFPGMSFFSAHHVGAAFFAHRAVKSREFDIIVAKCQYTAFAARDLLRHCGIPFVIHIYDPSTFMAQKIYRKRNRWKYPLMYVGGLWLDHYAVAKCRAVITSGTFHHKRIRELTDKPIEVLPDGCFVMEEFRPFTSREPMIVAFDRWDIGNIPNICIDVLEMVRNKNVTLTIGGFWYPESLRDNFVAYVKAKGLEKRVNILGPLDDAMIMNLCSKAMVHLHPIHESFGLTTLEAAACGCPGIIPSGSGVAELFEDGVSGFHPTVGDVGAMAKCVDRIMEDLSFAERMGRAAWEVAKNYTWLDYARRLKQIVEKYI